MFHLFPSLLVRPLFRWLSPPPLACCRWSWLRWLSALVPLVAVAMLCFFSWFGLVVVRFGSVLILYHICLDMRRVVKDSIGKQRKPGSL
ncbi:hypothetical protein GQ42DRAFT_165937 [Ramicandelaber brevisporus]|nr:hypothetical protein GQ42DRAFT_165937 [Ramicandelaber brevisporus]